VQAGNPPPEGLPMFDGRRRVGESSLGQPMTVLPYAPDVPQPFFVSQFRDPRSPNDPNFFNLQVPVRPLQAGTARGDSGGPLFAVIGGQLVQIGVVRGGGPTLEINYCVGPEGPEEPPVKCDQNNTVKTGVLESNGYGEFSDWTPISLFLQWINENNPLRKVTA